MRNNYEVKVDDLPANTPCTCSGCGAKHLYSALSDIEDCWLTPGDANPAGRCPDPGCDSLAYPIRLKDVINDHRMELFALAKRAVAATNRLTRCKKKSAHSKKIATEIGHALRDMGLLTRRITKESKP